MARSRAISIAKFRGREKVSKISVRNSPRIAPNRTCRGMPTLGTVCGDLGGSWPGCSTWGTADFGAISCDFDRKILRSRNFFRKFRSESTRTNAEKTGHVPSRSPQFLNPTQIAETGRVFISEGCPVSSRKP